MEAPAGYHLYGSFGRGGNPQFAMEKEGGDQYFEVEDLLDFSNEDDCFGGDDEVGLDGAAVNSAEGSVVTAGGGPNTSCGHHPQFSVELGCPSFADAGLSDDLCAPYDELAELDWLSTFVEEPFSCEDMQKLQLISGVKPTSSSCSSSDARSGVSTAQATPPLRPENHVPGKARSKRSRPAPTCWSSRLLVLPQVATAAFEVAPVPADPRPGSARKKKTPKPAEREGSDGPVDGPKCLHCATERTPQWRAGPMGPKTLCNACGVRYKSGRLVPEYRPAASPTFVLSKHSNSHRRVLELRRQKELQQQQNGSGEFMHPAGGVCCEARARRVGDQFLLRHRAGRRDLPQLA
ncbi:hypothetical protein Taro_035610 [Colocasia esculenta]|uniref:GATA transcription factor n=1 Tax=Colocasia esculenta TaxID=4460 RepID=A0A843VZE1_COLES|nr:hypothetical protein [Colocasia esculenta]